MCAYYIFETWAWPPQLGNHGMNYCMEQNILVVRPAEALPFVCTQQSLVTWFVEVRLWHQDQALYWNKDLYR